MSEIHNEHISDSPLKQAWKRLLRNKAAVIGMFVIIASILVAILGYIITPDSTTHSNDMVLQIGTKSPGFSVTMLAVAKNKIIPKQNIFTTMFLGKENPHTYIPIVGYSFEGNNIEVNEYIGEGSFGNILKIDLTDVVYAKSITNPSVKIVNDTVMFYDIDEKLVKTTISALRKEAESKHIIVKKYLMGTDKFGRDILSRMIIGVRVSLSVGFISVLISLLIGITMGALAGYYRGRVDNAVMWFINVIWSIPTLLLVFAITLALGKGFWQIFVAVGLTMWVEVARIIRGQVLVIREIEFVEAARSLGYGHFRIVTKHILPNVLGPVMVIAAANFAAAILIEAGLSFLGIGVQPPMPSWGMMIKEHYNYIVSNDPFLAIIPGFAIMIMVLAFNLLGNGFRDALDVKSKSE